MTGMRHFTASLALIERWPGEWRSPGPFRILRRAPSQMVRGRACAHHGRALRPRREPGGTLCTGQSTRPANCPNPPRRHKYTLSGSTEALIVRTTTRSSRFLAGRLATLHRTVGAGLGFIEFALIVTVCSSLVVFGTYLVLAGGLPMGSACCRIRIWHDTFLH